MKIGIGADTGDFEKGARKVKQEMKDLNKVSSDAFAAIGNALGIDVGKVQQFSSALSGLGNKLTQTGQAGTSAFSSIAKSITPVAAGIAGLGLAAAIAAFKQLNAESDAFEATIQGGVIKAQTEAYAQTFRQFIRDQQGTGSWFSNLRAKTNEFFTNWKGLFQSSGNLFTVAGAYQAGKRAKQIATELYDIELQRKENSVQIAQIDAQIAQQREIISDTSRSAAERSAALAIAQDLIKQKLDLQLPLAERQRDLLEEYNSLASTTIKEYDAEIAAKIQVNNLIQQEAAEQRSLLRQQNQINAALQKTNALQQRPSLTGIGSVGSGFMLGNVVQVPVEFIADTRSFSNIKQLAEFELAGISVSVDFELDAEKWKYIAQKAVNGIKNAVASAAVEMSEAIGTLVGELVSGEGGWDNFANAALSAFGNMAQSIGKIAIEAGTSVLMLDASLKSMSPTAAYAAIAAGVALVALGAAVKAGLSSIASGNYSAGMGVATSTSSSFVSDYQQRDVYVNVTGTLQADGDQLVAVISNTEKKRRITT